ncbi:hypothetical protein P4S54_21365 [Shewanella sp. PP-He15 brown]
MSKSLSIVVAKDRAMNQAVVDIDADPDAERLLVINRGSGDVYHNFKYETNRILKFRVPIEHLANTELLVGIMDDSLTYNAKFVDGVQAELIDGNFVNIRP